MAVAGQTAASAEGENEQDSGLLRRWYKRQMGRLASSDTADNARNTKVKEQERRAKRGHDLARNPPMDRGNAT